MSCGEYPVRWNRADPALSVSYPDYGSRLYCLLGRVGGGGVPREGLASLLGRGSNGVKVLYTLLRDCGVFIFNLLYYSKNAAPPRAGGLAL